MRVKTKSWSRLREPMRAETALDPAFTGANWALPPRGVQVNEGPHYKNRAAVLSSGFNLALAVQKSGAQSARIDGRAKRGCSGASIEPLSREWMPRTRLREQPLARLRILDKNRTD